MPTLTPLQSLQGRLNARSAELSARNQRTRIASERLNVGTNDAFASLRKAQAERGASFNNTSALLAKLAPTSAGAAFGAGVFGALDDFSDARGRRVEDAQVALQEARALRAEAANELALRSQLDQQEFEAKNTLDLQAIEQINLETGRNLTIDEARKQREFLTTQQNAGFVNAETLQEKRIAADAALQNSKNDSQFSRLGLQLASTAALQNDAQDADVDSQTRAIDAAATNLDTQIAATSADIATRTAATSADVATRVDAAATNLDTQIAATSADVATRTAAASGDLATRIAADEARLDTTIEAEASNLGARLAAATSDLGVKLDAERVNLGTQINATSRDVATRIQGRADAAVQLRRDEIADQVLAAQVLQLQSNTEYAANQTKQGLKVEQINSGLSSLRRQDGKINEQITAAQKSLDTLGATLRARPELSGVNVQKLVSTVLATADDIGSGAKASEGDRDMYQRYRVKAQVEAQKLVDRFLEVTPITGPRSDEYAPLINLLQQAQQQQ